MGFLSVKEVGRSALAIPHSTLNTLEARGGKGRRQAGVCVPGQRGDAQKSRELSYSRDTETGSDALTQETAGTGRQGTSDVDGKSKVVRGAQRDIQWQQQAADTGIRDMQKIET